MRALLLMLEGDAVEAEVTLRGALSLWEEAGDRFAGEHASCWRDLGLLLGGRGRTDEALDAFDHAARIEARWGGVPAMLAPNTLPGAAERLRGEALMDAGRLDEAAVALDAARSTSARARVASASTSMATLAAARTASSRSQSSPSSSARFAARSRCAAALGSRAARWTCPSTSVASATSGATSSCSAKASSSSSSTMRDAGPSRIAAVRSAANRPRLAATAST